MCVFYSGSEELAVELRFRTCVEMVTRRREYMTHPLTDRFRQMSGCNDSINDCQWNGPSSIWTMLAMSSVLQRRIVSIYPSLNGSDDAYVNIANVILHPLTAERPGLLPLFLMWSRQSNNGGTIWLPNHFVPVLWSAGGGPTPPGDRGDGTPTRGSDSPSEGGPETHDQRGGVEDHSGGGVESHSGGGVEGHSGGGVEGHSGDGEQIDYEITVIKTGKDKPCICYRGFSYRFDKRGRSDTLFFRCTSMSCHGRIQTEFDYSNLRVCNADHNHPPCPELVKVRKVMHDMRVQAKESTDSISAIYRRCTATLAPTPAAAAMMPSLITVDSGLYQQRHKITPSGPASRVDLEVPQRFRQTTSGEDFFMHQTHNNNILIFCTPTNLRRLCEADLVCIDGTFDAAPNLFAQLFTIQAFQHDKQFPLVYCLLSSKERTAYGEVFQVCLSNSKVHLLDRIRVVSCNVGGYN
jgi:hypothetical protein